MGVFIKDGDEKYQDIRMQIGLISHFGNGLHWSVFFGNGLLPGTIYVFIEANLLSNKSEKQQMVSRTSVDLEYWFTVDIKSDVI